jgi:hypothetical protein
MDRKNVVHEELKLPREVTQCYVTPPGALLLLLVGPKIVCVLVMRFRR